MKLTIFCSPQRKNILPSLMPLFDDLFIETHAFFCENSWNRSVIRELNEGMLYSDYILVLPVKDDLNTSWLAYVLGAAGSENKQILINTEDQQTGALFSEILDLYLWSSDLESLQAHLEEVLPLWNEKTRNRIARRVLQDRLDDHVFEGLARAVEKGDRFMVGVYMDAGFDINKESQDHVTLVGLAARNGYMEILEILVDAGGDIDKISTDRNNSPLMDAASEGHMEILRFLLDRHAGLETKSKSGQTALVLAVGNKKSDCAMELIKAGADPDVSDQLGFSARKYAQLYGMQDLLDIMPVKF